MDTENRLTAVRGESNGEILGGWVRREKGFIQKKPLIDSDNSVVVTRGKGVGETGEGEGEIKGDGSRLDWGGEPTIQYTHDVLEICTPETYVIFPTKVIPINSIFKNHL